MLAAIASVASHSWLRTALAWALDLGLGAGVGVVVLGALGGTITLLDGFNQLQPVWAAAALMALALAWFLGVPDRVWIAAVLASVHVMLYLAPMLRLPSMASHATAAQGRTLKVMTFNSYWWNQTPERLVALIREEAPDIVMLQETGSRQMLVIDRLLRADYPHRFISGQDWMTDGALFSKLPMSEAQQIRRGEHNPPAVAARVDLGGGRMLRVISVHLVNPRGPRRQQRELAWLKGELARQRDLVLLAGDFNLTPWTFTLNRFARDADLVRHDRMLGSWPASRYIPTVFPIDHIFTSRGITASSVELGPRAGSDHLPLIATLHLPR